MYAKSGAEIREQSGWRIAEHFGNPQTESAALNKGSLVVDWSHIGKISLRDQLPYTSTFDDMVSALNARAGLNLSPNDVWRVIAKLAK